MVNDYYEQIIQFLSTWKASDDFTTSQKKQLVIRATYFQVIVGQLYNMGPNEILWQHVIPHEKERISTEEHDVVTGGYYGGHTTIRKIL